MIKGKLRGTGGRMNALKFGAILNYNSGVQLAQSLGTLQCHPRQQLLRAKTIFARYPRYRALHNPCLQGESR
jgi:hypothetical protein